MEAVLCLSIVTSLSGTLDQRCGTLRDGRFVPGNGSLASLITSSLFDWMLKHRDDAACPAKGFYTYDAFVAAAATFRGFATTGDADTRKREVAAFLAQTSHETTGDKGGSLGVDTDSDKSTSLYCDNYGVITQIREPGSHQKCSEEVPACKRDRNPRRCSKVLRPRAFPDLLVKKLSLTPRTKSLLSIPAILAIT
ncbi:unnamed protein product [Musa hybrid cultivar]